MSWIHTPTEASPRAVALGRRGAWLVVAVTAIVLWFGVRHGIGSSWRECDTQAIARNFVLDGFDPLRPRVDWRGDTDGAVECEFPAYQLLVGALLFAFGDVEWPGRVLSLLSLSVAMLALHRLLEQRAGPAGALAGLIAFASTGSVFLLGTRVMPDATSLAFGLLSLPPFVRYLATGSGLALTLATASLALAGLQKPPALQLGLLWFGWALVHAPARLREARLWLAFAVVPGCTAAWLLHAHSLHVETGLTFGVVGGGDSKLPDLHHLLSLRTWGELVVTCACYGASVFGMAAGLWLLVRRRLERDDVVFGIAIAVGLLISLRYSFTVALGPHYHMFAAAFGAWLVARAWPVAASRYFTLAALVLAAVQAIWHLRDERGMRNVVNEHAVVEAAAVVAAHTATDEAIMVRGEKTRLDRDWGRPNNYEDPRVFYLARRRGHARSSDGVDPAWLTAMRGRGLRILVDLAWQQPSSTRAWLEEHAEVLFATDRIRVYRLR